MSFHCALGYLHELLQVTYLLVRLSIAHSLDCFGALHDGVHDFVDRFDCGIGCLFALELHRVTEPFRLRVFDMADMRAIMLWRRV